MIQVEFSSQSCVVNATWSSPALLKSFASSAAEDEEQTQYKRTVPQNRAGCAVVRGCTCAELEELVAGLRADVVLVKPLEQLAETLVHLRSIHTQRCQSQTRSVERKVAGRNRSLRSCGKHCMQSSKLTSSIFLFATAEVFAADDCV